MKILIVSHGIPTDYDPQWGCFELDQAKALKKLGHDVQMVSLDGRCRPGMKRKFGITESIRENIPCYSLYGGPLGFLYFSKLKLYVRLQMMKFVVEYAMKKHGRPDVIYAHYATNIADIVKVKELYKIPTVGLEHWSAINQEHIASYPSAKVKQGYPYMDRLYAVSPALKNNIKKHFGFDAGVIYDMVGEEFLKAELPPKKQKDTFHFVSVGSLNEIKRFNVLIDAFSRMKNAKADLTIIGGGNLHSNLQKQINDLGLEKRVFLVGLKNKQEIIKYLSSSHAFVLASSSETFGVVYIEAMAMGLPVIATRCGGPDYFVNDTCGKLVDVDNVEQLANAMEFMIENTGKYDSQAIREYCDSRFSSVTIAKQLEQIFLELTNI